MAIKLFPLDAVVRYLIDFVARDNFLDQIVYGQTPCQNKFVVSKKYVWIIKGRSQIGTIKKS